MDALYLNDVKRYCQPFDITTFEKKVRREIFPYCEYPFAKIAIAADSPKYELHIDSIKSVSEEEMDQLGDTKGVFATDTGLILFVNEAKLNSFLSDYDYDSLVDSSPDLLNLKYWEFLVSKFMKDDIALMLSADANSELDFCGSGIYTIILPLPHKIPN